MKLTLGQRVRKARKHFGLDRKTVAARAGMAYSTLADIENEATATCTKIAQLAKALGVNPLWLETEEGEMVLLSNPGTDTKPDALIAALEYLDTVLPAKAAMFRSLILEAEEDARLKHGDGRPIPKSPRPKARATG